MIRSESLVRETEGAEVRHVQKESTAVWDREVGGRGPGSEASLTTPLALVFHLKGKAVFLARDKHHLSDICHLIRHDVPYLFQKYVKESHGKDIRVVVVGGRVIGSMLRCSTDGRMQSNCSLGKVEKLTLRFSVRGFSLGCLHPFSKCRSIPPILSSPLRGTRITDKNEKQALSCHSKQPRKGTDGCRCRDGGQAWVSGH